MIKRKYFLSVKVAHNNGTGEYSWWSAILNTRGWTQSHDNLLIQVRELAADELGNKMSRIINSQDVEVLALNKL